MRPYLMRRVRVRIYGHVQGVFFRTSCLDRAERLGLSGWVRNVEGGGVEAVFEGHAPAVAQMLTWCREGPPLASVDRVESVDQAPTGGSGFRITR
jgi:acylphosphatase